MIGAGVLALLLVLTISLISAVGRGDQDDPGAVAAPPARTTERARPRPPAPPRPPASPHWSATIVLDCDLADGGERVFRLQLEKDEPPDWSQVWDKEPYWCRVNQRVGGWDNLSDLEEEAIEASDYANVRTLQDLYTACGSVRDDGSPEPWLRLARYKETILAQSEGFLGGRRDMT